MGSTHPLLGQQNIEKGVTIDLGSFNSVTLRQADATTGLPVGDLNADDAGGDAASDTNSDGKGNDRLVASVGGRRNLESSV